MIVFQLGPEVRKQNQLKMDKIIQRIKYFHCQQYLQNLINLIMAKPHYQKQN